MSVARLSSLRIGQSDLPIPAYFPSISSVKTALKPLDYLRVLSSLTGLNGQFLVSAFDLAACDNPAMAINLLQNVRNMGAISLMDSGSYESFWKDAQAKWKQTSFHEVLREFSCDLAFSFDEQQPPNDNKAHIELIVTRWRQDQAAAGDCLIVPIVHGTRDNFPELCASVAEATGVPMVAVAERRLGDGVLDRAHTVDAIRTALNGGGRYVGLHLLGTGNPVSIAIYSVMGADSFDGLEWCQTVVDHETATLFHLSQADFFKTQTSWADSGLSFNARTLAHNLEFYFDWMRRLRAALDNGKVVDFCRYNFPDRIFKQCVFAFGWE